VDIAIPKKKKSKIKQFIVISLIVMPLIFVTDYLWFLSKTELSIDRETLVIDEVRQGNYTVTVRGTGVLVPDNIQWLSATVEATVARLVLKAGNVVNEGDLIVELANPQLMQKLSEAKWELEAMAAEFKAAKVDQESTLLDKKSNVLNAKLDYESSLLKSTMQTEFLNQTTGVVTISKLDYQTTLLETNHFKQRWLISEDQLVKMQENLIAQDNARSARLNKTKKSLERIQQQVDDLQVRASMNSIILEMPLQVGQRISMGANIAKLAQQNSLIAELQVPEIQIRDVAIGQQVTIDTHNNKIDGRIYRIDPAVINGNVQVDVIFSEPLPDDARPDLSVNGEIKIIEITDTLYVNRPLFAQSKSHSTFYKLHEDENLVERVNVVVGSGSINQIQIIEGLQVGDKIVTSDPTRFESYDIFRIN